jgi:hypothetical protein
LIQVQLKDIKHFYGDADAPHVAEVNDPQVLQAPVGGSSEDEVVEDGGVGSDADAAADHDGDLELVPVLTVNGIKTSLLRQ